MHLKQDTASSMEKGAKIFTHAGLLASCIAEEEAAERILEEEDNGLVSYDELLPWFLNVGYTYLPRPVYQAVEELDEPTEEEVKVMFAAMDEDGSGEVNEQEVKAGTLQRWPYLDTSLIGKAFAAADADGSGVVSFDEFDELVECLQFLNKNRHLIHELADQFETGGVGTDEFYIGLAALSMPVTEKQALHLFDAECVHLATERLGIGEYLAWLCRFECVGGVADAAAEQAALAEAAFALQENANDFGDIFFEDLAKVMFVHRSSAGRNLNKGKSKSKEAVGKFAHLQSAKQEAYDRYTSLKTGIELATAKRETFPEIPETVLRALCRCASSELYYSGQSFITQGMEQDSFFVIRRGKADLIIDGAKHKSFVAGDPIGEIALMYQSRRSGTVQAAGPCEVYCINRASYDTCMQSIPEEDRLGELLKIKRKFWALVTGPDGTGNQYCDYATYLKYHIRVSKTLMDASDMDGFDEDEQREIAQEDWAEDTKRFDVKVTGALTLPMFFDSINQMVSLWAGDLSLSFTTFLDILFENVAVWEPEAEGVPGHWRFKRLDEVVSKSDEVEAIQNEARVRQEAEEQSKAAFDADAEKHRLEQEEQDKARREAMRLANEMRERTKRRKAFMEGATKRLQQLEREETLIKRQLTNAVLSKPEAESMRRRLAEIPISKNAILTEMLEYDETELVRRLNNGQVLTELDEEECRRALFEFNRSKTMLKKENLATEKAEAERRLNTVLDRAALIKLERKMSSEDEAALKRNMRVTPHECNELERRLPNIEEQELPVLELALLDGEVDELNRRLVAGVFMGPEEEETSRKRLADIMLNERKQVLDAMARRITVNLCLRLLEKAMNQNKCHTRTHTPRVEPTPGSQIHVRGVGGALEVKAALVSVFVQFGPVVATSVRHRIDEETGENTSWALVTMGRRESAEAVMAGAASLPAPLTVTRFSQKQADESTGQMRQVRREAAAHMASTLSAMEDLDKSQQSSSVALTPLGTLGAYCPDLQQSAALCPKKNDFLSHTFVGTTR